MRVHGVELTGLDEGRDDRPVGAALVTAGEQGIFSAQRSRPDGALNDIGIDLDAAIVQEPTKTLPVARAVAHGFCDWRTAGDALQLLVEPQAQGFDERTGSGLPFRTALFRGSAGTSYRFQFGQWHISPQLDVMITNTEADSVSERDRNGAALGLEATNDTYFVVMPSIELGGNFTAWAHAVIRPYLRAGLTFNTNPDFAVSTVLLDGPATGRFQTITEIDEVMSDL